MRTIRWVTDPHYLHHPDRIQVIADHCQNLNQQILLLGGDLASGASLVKHLNYLNRELASAQNQAFLVLGNHDFYESSIQDIRQTLQKTPFSQIRVFEPGFSSEPHLLHPQVVIVGTGGVGDCLGGQYSPLLDLNDERYIAELKTGDLKRNLLKLSHEHCQYLETQLAQVPETVQYLVILTHVPPWAKASWHEGKISPLQGLTRFAWIQGGELIEAWSQTRPNTHILVLCGHCHSGGTVEITPSITCHTGGATYGTFHINGEVQWTAKDGFCVKRLDSHVN